MSEEIREVVGPGKFVAFSYKLYNDADGKLLFEATPEQPDVMVYGCLLFLLQCGSATGAI